jgi:hypothetical protein
MLHLKPVQHPAVAIAGLVSVLMLIGGCASDGASSNPLEGLKNPFQRTTDSDFFALVRDRCSAYSVGGQSLGTRLDGDSELRDLSAKLYRGDLSNDEFVNRLMQLYPADDANIPAAGCVVNQVNACLSRRCEPRTGQAPELQQAEATIEAEQAKAASRVPAADRRAVEQMIDNADAVQAADFDSEP